MSNLESIILGIIQGLTEFLPVSSSGHLELAKAIFGDGKVPEEGLLMTVVLHFATALSTVVIFRKDIVEIFKGLFQFKLNEEFYFSLKIIFSMIPAAVVGVIFKDELESLFNGETLLVGLMLMITALLLFVADRAKNTNKPINFLEAFVIGVAQAIAILPGISRSGATICTSVLLGIDKGKAARFSFLMVVPLIFGKMAKDMLDGDIMTSSTHFTPLILGFTAAFITGLFACNLMIKLVKKSQLKYFAYYCFTAGIVGIIFHFVR